MNAFELVIADFAKMTGLPLTPDVRGESADVPDVGGADPSSFIRA